MSYAAGLMFTVAICGWLSFNYLFVERWRRSSRAMGLLSTSALFWAAGELLLLTAEGPAERAVARRVLFLGPCFIAPPWLALAIQSAHPETWRRHRWWLFASLPIPVFIYSTLYWAPGPWFVDPSAEAPRHGPLFALLLLYNWPMLLLGIGVFLGAMKRIEAAWGRRFAVLLGSALPFAGNALYQLGAFGTTDPTPVLIGLGGLTICLALIHAGLGLELPIARNRVVELLDLGIVVADDADRVVDANPAAARLLGRPLLGCSRSEIRAWVARHDERDLGVQEFELAGGLGRVGWALLLTDRTETVAAQRRLELAGRLEALGHLIAGIAHEVNNPLAYIRANLNQLEELAWAWAEAEPGAPVAEAVRERSGSACEIVAETQQGVDRMAELVRRLRAFTGQGAGGREDHLLSLADVARHARDMASVGLGDQAIEMRVWEAPKVRGCEAELVQIVLNLLVNAIQASPASVTPRAEIEIVGEDGGSVLRVLDRGAGIATADLGRLFDPFFTTKPPDIGTGLGLSISFDLARQHRGRLEAGNRPGGGAVFSLWLPSAAD